MYSRPYTARAHVLSEFAKHKLCKGVHGRGGGQEDEVGVGGGACLETSGQLTSKHEAIQLVGAVGHEVALIPYSTALHGMHQHVRQMPAANVTQSRSLKTHLECGTITLHVRVFSQRSAEVATEQST